MELWEDPNFAHANRMRVPKLEPLLGMRKPAAASAPLVAEGAAANAPAFPLAATIFTLDPSTQADQPPAAMASDATAKQAERQPKGVGGAAAKAKLERGGAAPKPEAAAAPPVLAANPGGDTSGEMEVYLTGRAGLGRDYRVHLNYQISIW